MSEKLILAFDTVVSSGDVSLWRDGHELSATTGDIARSSSETLLTSISQSFENGGVEKREIDLIALTVGPGSYTGIRIGIATALGLAASIGCEIVGLSTLELLANCADTDNKVVSGVWAGRDEIVHQEFNLSKKDKGDVTLLSVENFVSKYGDTERQVILDNRSLQAITAGFENKPLNLVTSPQNIASMLNRVVTENSQHHLAAGDLKPIYSRSLFDQ